MTLRGCVSMVNGVKGPSVIRFEDVVLFMFFYGFKCIFRTFYVTLFTLSYFVFKTMGTDILLIFMKVTFVSTSL